jgi:hypothetical protein
MPANVVPAVRQQRRRPPRAQRSRLLQAPRWEPAWYGEEGLCQATCEAVMMRLVVTHRLNSRVTAATHRVLGMQGPPGGGMPGMMGMDPQQMQQMMGSPIVQNLLDNPEFLRSMMQSNPALRQVHMI